MVYLGPVSASWSMPDGLTKSDRAWVAAHLALAETEPAAPQPPKHDSLAAIRIEHERIADDLRQIRFGLDRRRSVLADSIRLEDVPGAAVRRYGPQPERGWCGETPPVILHAATQRRQNGL